MHLYALKLGVLDPLSSQALRRFKKEVLEFARKEYPEALKRLTVNWKLTDELKKEFELIFRAYFAAQNKAA